MLPKSLTKNVCDMTFSSFNRNKGKILYLNSLFKIYTLNILLAKVESGLVTTLLEGGLTVHSTFILKIKIYSNDFSSFCNLFCKNKENLNQLG